MKSLFAAGCLMAALCLGHCLDLGSQDGYDFSSFYGTYPVLLARTATTCYIFPSTTVPTDESKFSNIRNQAIDIIDNRKGWNITPEHIRSQYDNDALYEACRGLQVIEYLSGLIKIE